MPKSVYSLEEKFAKELFQGDYCDPEYCNWDDVSVKKAMMALLKVLSE